jgi:hypothetical protein
MFYNACTITCLDQNITSFGHLRCKCYIGNASTLWIFFLNFYNHPHCLTKEKFAWWLVTKQKQFQIIRTK